VGLVPLHNWLPDAHAEGPTPISAVLSGLLLNVAIYAVVRCKLLVAGALNTAWPSEMLMAFGILSVVVGASCLWRQREAKRLFAYSSIEHMGIITFAFGMGGPIANFAALLHLTAHSLTKSAIYFAWAPPRRSPAPRCSSGSAASSRSVPSSAGVSWSVRWRSSGRRRSVYSRANF
jgi:hydrogenase-4 component F